VSSSAVVADDLLEEPGGLLARDALLGPALREIGSFELIAGRVVGAAETRGCPAGRENQSSGTSVFPCAAANQPMVETGTKRWNTE